MTRFFEDGDDGDQPLALWRRAQTNALAGRRGKAFLTTLIQALDAIPGHVLGHSALAYGGQVCALGAVLCYTDMQRSGVDWATAIDAYDNEPDGDPECAEDANEDPYSNSVRARQVLGKALVHPLAIAIQWVNDDILSDSFYTPAERWQEMRAWAVRTLADPNGWYKEPGEVEDSAGVS